MVRIAMKSPAMLEGVVLWQQAVRIRNQTRKICCIAADDRMLHVYSSVVVCQRLRYS